MQEFQNFLHHNKLVFEFPSRELSEVLSQGETLISVTPMSSRHLRVNPDLVP